MDGQLIMAGLVVAAAAAYLGWRGLRTWTRRGGGTCGGCSCAKGATTAGAGGGQRVVVQELRLRIHDRENS